MYKKRLAIFFTAVFLYLSVFSCGSNLVFSDNENIKKKTELVLCEVLIEVETKTILTSVNGNIKIPIGTMAKLMTVFLAAEAIENGKLTLESVKKTSVYANSMQGAQIWLMPGEEMTISDLLKGVIIGNANDASVSIAEAVAGTEDKFVKEMNNKAIELGMNNTSFTNCNGYYDDSKQISTATDLAILVSKLSEFENMKGYFTCWLDYLRDGATELVNANTLVRSYEGLTGFKAGYTDSSGFCVAAGAERNGVSYVSIVMGCDDKDMSFTEAKRLLNNGFTGYQKIKPDMPKNIPQVIRVKGGIKKEIPLSINEIKDIIIPNGSSKSVTSKVIVPDYIYAPVEKGQAVGEIQFYKNEKLLFAVDITAADDSYIMNLKKAVSIMFKFISTF